MRTIAYDQSAGIFRVVGGFQFEDTKVDASFVRERSACALRCALKARKVKDAVVSETTGVQERKNPPWPASSQEMTSRRITQLSSNTPADRINKL
jgi:hypothetical protein